MGIFEFRKKLNSNSLKFSSSYLMFPQFVKCKCPLSKLQVFLLLIPIRNGWIKYLKCV